MNRAIVRTFFRERLLLVDGLPTTAGGAPLVAWADEDAFTPPAADPYLVEEFRPGTATSVANGTHDARPQYVLDLYTPPGFDPAAIDALDGALENAFQPGRTMTDAARTHQLELTSYNPGTPRRAAKNWTVRRITIGATALAFRTTLTV
jgi:hypothetical protein